MASEHWPYVLNRDGIELLNMLNAQRKSFRAYVGPVSFLIMPLQSKTSATDHDMELLMGSNEWAEENCVGRFWVMWTPCLVKNAKIMDESGRDACVAFAELEDAALFMLSNNFGLMKTGFANKGEVDVA